MTIENIKVSKIDISASELNREKKMQDDKKDGVIFIFHSKRRQ
jgi:hypothetical protein